MRKLVILPLIILLIACSEREKGTSTEQTQTVEVPGPVVMDEAEMERWEIDLVEMRIEKNEALQDSAQTSLPQDEIATFEGLNYYFPEPSWRYRVPFKAAAQTDTVIMTKRSGKQVPYAVKGTVTFNAAGKPHTLTVFGPVDPTAGDYLWLPFYDLTNEKDTYPGGRYLDLKLDSDGQVELDFNFAYNPLCDYNPSKYDCTFPPRQNSLPFAIPAGEKRYRQVN